MGAVTVTGAILIITCWFALVEYDSFPESERKQILQRIKRSPAHILLIALMPAGIFINVLGTFFGSLWMVIIGASFIFLKASLFHSCSGNEKDGKVSCCLLLLLH